MWACIAYICLSLSSHSLIIQPNFQVCLSVEESSQEASKSSYKYLTWYDFLTCTDVKRDVWEGPIMTEPNKDDMSIERRNVGERPTTTENGMYKSALWYYFLIPFSSSQVPQANMFTQAHDFQINDGIFNNIVSNQLIKNASVLRPLVYYRSISMTTEKLRPIEQSSQMWVIKWVKSTTSLYNY